MKVDLKMTVEDSHQITDDLSRDITGRLPNSSVTIHVEPYDGRCESDCKEGCLLTDDEQKAVGQRGFLRQHFHIFSQFRREWPVDNISDIC